MFNAKTMPIQLRDYLEVLVARDTCYAEMHGTVLEEDLGVFYQRSRSSVLWPAADERFNFTYLQVRKANGLWRSGQWEAAAAVIEFVIGAFDGNQPSGPEGE